MSMPLFETYFKVVDLFQV